MSDVGYNIVLVNTVLSDFDESRKTNYTNSHKVTCKLSSRFTSARGGSHTADDVDAIRTKKNYHYLANKSIIRTRKKQ